MVPRGDDGPASVDDDDDNDGDGDDGPASVDDDDVDGGDGDDGPASVEVKIGLLGFGSRRQEVGGRGTRREESGFQVKLKLILFLKLMMAGNGR